MVYGLVYGLVYGSSLGLLNLNGACRRSYGPSPQRLSESYGVQSACALGCLPYWRVVSP